MFTDTQGGRRFVQRTIRHHCSNANNGTMRRGHDDSPPPRTVRPRRRPPEYSWGARGQPGCEKEPMAVLRTQRGGLAPWDLRRGSCHERRVTCRERSVTCRNLRHPHCSNTNNGGTQVNQQNKKAEQDAVQRTNGTLERPVGNLMPVWTT